MKDGLHISDPTSFPLADYHRLLQKPLFKNGIKVTRPIVIELTCAPDKRRIFKKSYDLPFDLLPEERIAQNIHIHNSNRNYKKLTTTTILIKKRIA